MATNIKTIKHGAGSYGVTDGEDTVSVYLRENGREWMAAAEWDCHRYSDPIETKRDAVKCAKNMLATKRDF